MNFVMILAPGFEELEAIGTADVLTRLGAKVTMAGLNSMNMKGSHGYTIVADALLAELKADNFAGVILPGGLPGATNLLESELVIRWVQGMYKADDDNTEVLYFRNATATFTSFGGAPKTVTF